MFNTDKKSVKRCSVLWLALAVMCLSLTADSRAAKMALLLQQSPAEGGSVEPGTGVHKLDGNSQVTLRAVPQPGFQFVTWLGDVDEPTSPVTTAYMDSPKIVIAVFERSRYASVEAADMLFSRPGGGGGLIRSAADISSGGGGGGGGSRSPRVYSRRTSEIPEIGEDFPVPGEGDGQEDFIPVPGEQVPEPATVILLAGGLAMARSRHKRTVQRSFDEKI